MILSLSPDVLGYGYFLWARHCGLGSVSESDVPTWTCLLFQKTAEEDQFEDMVKQVKESLKEQDQILIKGSNSMHLAKLVEELEKA